MLENDISQMFSLFHVFFIVILCHLLRSVSFGGFNVYLGLFYFILFVILIILVLQLKLISVSFQRNIKFVFLMFYM